MKQPFSEMFRVGPAVQLGVAWAVVLGLACGAVTAEELPAGWKLISLPYSYTDGDVIQVPVPASLDGIGAKDKDLKPEQKEAGARIVTAGFTVENMMIEFSVTSSDAASLQKGEPSRDGLRKKYADVGFEVLEDETLGGQTYVHFKLSPTSHGYALPLIFKGRGIIFNVGVTSAGDGKLALDDGLNLWRRMAGFVRGLPTELTDEEVRNLLENLRNGKVVPSPPSSAEEQKPTRVDP